MISAASRPSQIGLHTTTTQVFWITGEIGVRRPLNEKQESAETGCFVFKLFNNTCNNVNNTVFIFDLSRQVSSSQVKSGKVSTQRIILPSGIFPSDIFKYKIFLQKIQSINVARLKYGGQD